MVGYSSLAWLLSGLLLLLSFPRLVQPSPECHLFLFELHTHTCIEIQLQVLFILVKAWPVGQLPVVGVPNPKVERD